MAMVKLVGYPTEISQSEFESLMFGLQKRTKFYLKAEKDEKYGVICEGPEDLEAALLDSIKDGKPVTFSARPFAVTSGKSGKPWVKFIVTAVRG